MRDLALAVKITPFHDPLRCMFLHCDLRFIKGRQNIPRIKRKKHKNEIRDYLRPLIRIELEGPLG